MRRLLRFEVSMVGYARALSHSHVLMSKDEYAARRFLVQHVCLGNRRTEGLDDGPVGKRGKR